MTPPILSLTLAQFGPFLAPTTIDLPDEGITVRARSGGGKTTILDALAHVMWGARADGSPVVTGVVRRGEDGIPKGTLTAAFGDTRVRVSLYPGPQWDRHAMVPGAAKPRRLNTATEATAFVDGLLPGAANADLGALLLAPDLWWDLYKDRGGRGLRDRIAKVLPAGDLRGTAARLLEEGGHALRADDPLSLADAPKTKGTGALAYQREANAEASRCRGVLDRAQAGVTEAEAALARLEASLPTEAALAEARAAIVLAEEWAVYDRERATWEASETARAAAQAAQERWAVDFAALGERPVVREGAVAEARAHVDALASERAALVAAVAVEEERVRAAAAEEERKRAATIEAERVRAAQTERRSEVSPLAVDAAVDMTGRATAGPGEGFTRADPPRFVPTPETPCPTCGTTDVR